MLKVSGEALAGPNGFGIDSEVVQEVARAVAVAVLSGVQVRAALHSAVYYLSESINKHVAVQSVRPISRHLAPGFGLCHAGDRC